MTDAKKAESQNTKTDEWKANKKVVHTFELSEDPNEQKQRRKTKEE